MGIHGLLPFLKPYVKKVNIEEFRGKTVGVDAMCWMHKGAFACSRELVEGEDTDKFVRFFLKMCEVLRCTRMKPIIVFDGDKLPAKAKEDQTRGKVREQARLEALELMERQRSGHEVNEKEIASKCESAIKVTASMISRLQSALKELSIDFMIAPYEADAQLAYMCRMGWIDVAISEDSDLLAYGCPSTLFKMDKWGNGDYIALPCLQVDAAVQVGAGEKQQLADKENTPPGQMDEGNAGKPKSKQKQRMKPTKSRKASQNGSKPSKPVCAPEMLAGDAAETQEAPGDAAKEVGSLKVRRARKAKAKPDKVAKAKDVKSSLDCWSAEQFAEFCVFCGTDYKEPEIHIKNFGIKTAFQFMQKYSNASDLLQWMVSDKGFRQRLPCAAEEYIPRYTSVVCVFWHHLVFNPRSGECTSISTAFPLTESRRHCPGLDPATVCGIVFPKQEALRVARGELDPRTRLPKTLEPLTPAERRAIDGMLDIKRRELDEKRQQDMQEQADKRRAEAEALRATQAEVPPTCDTGEALPDEPTPSVEAREIKLLPGDVRRLMQFHELRNDESEEMRQSGTASNQVADTGTSKASNPFLRKRTPQSMGGMAVPGAKVGSQRPAIRGLAARKEVAEPLGDAGTFKKPEYHPRGGGAANLAVEAVLAQRGLLGLKLDEDKDKSKLKYFFPHGGKTREAHSKSPDVPKVDTLSSWNSRPWEVEPEAPAAAPRENVLSMRKRKTMACFRSRT